jgi:uncharacterized protein
MPAGIAAFDLLFLCLAFAGHIAMGVAFFNQMHSAWLPPHFVHRLERVTMLLTGVGPFLIAVILLITPVTARDSGHFLPKLIGAAPWSWVWLYLAPCAIFGVFSAVRWLRNRLRYRTPAALQSKKSILRERFPASNLLARLPGNEAMTIEVEEKQFVLPRWPVALDAFRIVHLSDLHITPRIGRDFFKRAIEIVNSLSPEIVVISGDICEQDDCIPWLDDFGAINTPFGSFFVLGNHDLRVHESIQIRHRLAAIGMIDLGGRWIIHTPRGVPLILAGNELPWFAPAAPMERCPKEIDGQRPPRLVVSHSPDQFLWARSFDADLMLAGHTHGGQIRLPWLGPLVAPSRYGVKYASGEFFEEPTLMHVSRGLSSLQPLRYGCPPEISLLILASGPPNE